MGFLADRLLPFFLPPQCHCCEKFLEEGQHGICSDCLSKIHWIEPPFCSVCGTPFASRSVEDHRCGDCLTGGKHFIMARALGSYEGILQRAIHLWKYQGKTLLTPDFGKWLEEGFHRYWNAPPFNLLIPVPMHQRRLRERGFNQALLLVKELSRRTGTPYRKRILRKVRLTIPQVRLSGREREKGVRGSFHIVGGEALEGKSILLVDDVYTTGATVNECAKVIRAAGAARVDVLTLAHALKAS